MTDGPALWVLRRTAERARAQSLPGTPGYAATSANEDVADTRWREFVLGATWEAKCAAIEAGEAQLRKVQHG